MAWPQRLREAAYTPPSGTRLVFEYTNVGRTTTKRTTAFEFANVDGAYVQDNGSGARVIPLRCYFSGPDHDLAATAFEEALLERGPGYLEHPFYGPAVVVPFGDIGRRDDLVTEANQTVIEVTFWRTIGDVYPSALQDPQSDVLAAVESFNAQAPAQFADSSDLRSIVAQESTKASVRGLLTVVSAAFEEAGAAVDAPARALEEAKQVLELSLDVLVGNPIELAAGIVNTLQAPARTAASVGGLLNAYANAASAVIESIAGSPPESVPVSERTALLVRNDFLTADLFASSAVMGSVLAAVDATFDARPHAISAAEDLLSQFEALVAWRDAGYASLEVVDTGASYQALQSAVALAIGYLVDTSFSLLPERRMVLTRPRTIIDLAAELYGSVDDRLDFLIDTNDLSGSEILEVQAGRTIVYYA